MWEKKVKKSRKSQHSIAQLSRFEFVLRFAQFGEFESGCSNIEYCKRRTRRTTDNKSHVKISRIYLYANSQLVNINNSQRATHQPTEDTRKKHPTKPVSSEAYPSTYSRLQHLDKSHEVQFLVCNSKSNITRRIWIDRHLSMETKS